MTVVKLPTTCSVGFLEICVQCDDSSWSGAVTLGFSFLSRLLFDCFGSDVSKEKELKRSQVLMSGSQVNSVCKY